RDAIEVAQVQHHVVADGVVAPRVQRRDHADLAAGVAVQDLQHLGFAPRLIAVPRRERHVAAEIDDRVHAPSYNSRSSTSWAAVWFMSPSMRMSAAVASGAAAPAL